MCIGIALYNTDKLSTQQAYRLATLFFETIDLCITQAAFRDKEGLFNSSTVSELTHLVSVNEVKDFRVYHKDSSNPPWMASFGYATDQYDSFCHIDMQCVLEIPDDKLQQFLKTCLEVTHAPYGIVYLNDNVVDAYEYVLEEGVVPLPPYEKHLLWRDEMLKFGGATRYKDKMLRMVYPYNLLNRQHLDITIQGVTLEHWIKEDTSLGELIDLGIGDYFIWKVPVKQLETINNLCGKEGILIGWKK